jgi:hypothetical protein
MSTPNPNIPGPGHQDYELFNSAVSAIRAIGNPSLVKDEQRLHQDALNLVVDAKQKNPDVKEFERVGQTRSNGFNYVAQTGEGQSFGGTVTMQERRDSIAESMAQLDEINRGRKQPAPTAPSQEENKPAAVSAVQLNSDNGPIKDQIPPGGAVYKDGDISASAVRRENTNADLVNPPEVARVSVTDNKNHVSASYTEVTPNLGSVARNEVVNDDPIRRAASVTIGPEGGTRATLNVSETSTSQTVGGQFEVSEGSIRASQTRTDAGAVRDNFGVNIAVNKEGGSVDYDRTVTTTPRGGVVSSVDALTYTIKEDGPSITASRERQLREPDKYSLDAEVPVSKTTAVTGGVSVQGAELLGRAGVKYDDGRFFAAAMAEVGSQGGSVEGRGGYRFDPNNALALAGRQTFGNESSSQIGLMYMNNPPPQNIGQAANAQSLDAMGPRFMVSQQLNSEGDRRLFEQASYAFDRMKPDQRAGLDPVAVPLAMMEEAKKTNPPLSSIEQMTPGKPGTDGKVSLFVGDGNLEKEATNRASLGMEQVKSLSDRDVPAMLDRVNAASRQNDAPQPGNTQIKSYTPETQEPLAMRAQR